MDEKEVSIGLTNLNSDILDKSSMVIDDRTTSKDIINYIIKTCNEMIENSALTKDKVLGLGVGVVPSMWGKLKIFYKDGILDFTNFIDKLSGGLEVDIHCGNAIGLMALANNEFRTANGYQTNQVFLYNGNQVNLAIINKNELSSDYVSYTSTIERYIVCPNGKSFEGYPNGSVKAELSRTAIINAFNDIYSKDKTPVLYEITEGDKSKINPDRVFMALMRGDEAGKDSRGRYHRKVHRPHQQSGYQPLCKEDSSPQFPPQRKAVRLLQERDDTSRQRRNCRQSCAQQARRKKQLPRRLRSHHSGQLLCERRNAVISAPYREIWRFSLSKNIF